MDGICRTSSYVKWGKDWGNCTDGQRKRQLKVSSTILDGSATAAPWYNPDTGFSVTKKKIKEDCGDASEY